MISYVKIFEMSSINLGPDILVDLHKFIFLVPMGIIYKRRSAFKNWVKNYVKLNGKEMDLKSIIL